MEQVCYSVFFIILSESLINICTIDLKILITKNVIFSRWERGDITVFQGYLHGGMWRKKNPKYAVMSILAMNGLKGEIGPSILWDSKTGKSGVYCAFEVSYLVLFKILRVSLIKNYIFELKKLITKIVITLQPLGELADQLVTKTKLNAGVCTWNLQRKLRKARTEEEVLEFSKAKKVKSA